jgi:hypothetical protein
MSYGTGELYVRGRAPGCDSVPDYAQAGRGIALWISQTSIMRPSLMFVDSLQDDRRDIAQPRFPEHGVLSDLRIDVQKKVVTAEVSLPEVEKGVFGWPGRIAEYIDVLNWINTTPGVKFVIDYKTRANLPRKP